MFGQLREILHTQYIGAMLIALLVWQATIEAVVTVVRGLFWLSGHLKNESVFGRSPSDVFPWDNLIFSAVTVAFYLLTAYGLVRWLYPPEATTPEAGKEEQSSTPDQPQQP